MTNKARNLAGAVAVACAMTANASAQAPVAAADVLTLSLDEAVERGLKASHRLEEAAAVSAVAEAVVDQRRAAALPHVAAQAGYTRTNHVEEFGVLSPDGQFRVIYPDVPDNVRTRLDAQWPIYTGGRQEAVERAARIEASATAIDRDAIVADLRLEIARAYWACVTAIDAARVVRDALVRTDAHLVDARNMLEAGLVAPNDVLVVEAQQARQLMMRIRADAQRDAAGAELARLVGAPPGARVSPSSRAGHDDGVPASLGGSSLAPDQLAADARRDRRDRAALVERLQAMEARRAAAAAGMRPTIAVGGGLDYARPNPRIFPRRGEWEPSWDASVNVNWPIADGGRTRAEMAEVEASARVLTARLAEFDGRLEVEIGQRVNDIAATRAAVVAAESGVRAAAEARRVAADRFAEGVATNTDVLNAQGAVLQAELDRTQAFADARLAEARLARTLGR